MSMHINKTLKARNLATLRGPRKIYGIVLHDTAGSGTHGDTKYLATDPERRGISVDFTVERDGTIYQLNPDPRTAYTSHAGRNTKFKNYVNGQVNRATIGIEICQKANLSLIPLWPDAQVKAVAELCAKLCIDYGIKKSDITTHQLIIRDGSRTDPRKWPFTLFWTYFNRSFAELVAQDDEMTVEEIVKMASKIKHQVSPGDTLYSLAKKYETTIEKIKALNNMNTASNAIYVGTELIVKD